jgi:ribosomal protein S18 acetylase RimI-like enzyme
MISMNHEDHLEGSDVTTTREADAVTPQQVSGPEAREARAAHQDPEDDGAVVVREAVGDDLAGILSVGHRTWLATYEPIAGPEYVAMGLAKWWTSDVVTDAIRKGRTFVAVRGEQVLGVATFGTQDDAFVIWKLYVLPQHHSQGIGSRLLAALVAQARESDHRRMTLSYLEGNRQAARFYARHGFVETHRERPGSGLPESVWMVRELDGGEVGS